MTPPIQFRVLGIPAPQGSKTRMPNGALLEAGSQTGRQKVSNEQIVDAYSRTGSEQRRPSLERNRLIVDRCHLLLAFPGDGPERGGTWYTINYARANGRHLIIIWPDGETSHENEPA